MKSLFVLKRHQRTFIQSSGHTSCPSFTKEQTFHCKLLSHVSDATGTPHEPAALLELILLRIFLTPFLTGEGVRNTHPAFRRLLQDYFSIHSSSTLVILLHPPVHSNLKITNHSFRHAAPHLRNKLPPILRVYYRQALILDRLLIFLMAFSSVILKFFFSRSLFLHGYLSLAEANLLQFDYSVTVVILVSAAG